MVLKLRVKGEAEGPWIIKSYLKHNLISWYNAKGASETAQFSNY
jgi:hypothetical protein